MPLAFPNNSRAGASDSSSLGGKRTCYSDDPLRISKAYNGLPSIHSHTQAELKERMDKYSSLAFPQLNVDQGFSCLYKYKPQVWWLFNLFNLCIYQSQSGDSESIESRTLLRQSGQFAFSFSHWSMHFLWNKWSHVSKSLTWSPDVNSPKHIGQLPSSPVFFFISSAFNFLVFNWRSSWRVSPCCSISCTSS